MFDCFVRRMTAVRTALWLMTRSPLRPPLWPPNKTSADSKSDALLPVHLQVAPLLYSQGFFPLLLQALYPHHGLPARSRPVDCGENSERVSVDLQI